MSVNRYSVFFKKWGKFHYRIESFTGYSRPRVRKLPQTAFRQLSSIKSLRGLPLPRVASGTPGKAPHLPQTTSWLHRATIAGSPIDAPPLPVEPESAQNQASSVVRASSVWVGSRHSSSELLVLALLNHQKRAHKLRIPIQFISGNARKKMWNAPLARCT